jgi:Tol biopolymer transport system component
VRLFLLLATVSLSLFWPLVPRNRAGTTEPQTGNSKIVFSSNREGSYQIYVMNDDGSGVVRLTNSGANDDLPRWSPNGTKILFQSDRDHPDTGFMDIYLMNSDGSGVIRLTTDANDDSMAAWSADGTKIAFQSMRNGMNYQVYAMNADGSNQINLSNSSSSDGEPSWSPDGTKIVFASDRDHAGTNGIYVMNSDGSNQHSLTSTNGTTEDMQPVWSPDGSKIAFVSTRDITTETWPETDDDGNYIIRSALHINKEIYVMNADGSGQTRLTNAPANDESPSWSPLGLTILFRSDRERECCDPAAQIWSMNADGTNQIDLSNDGNSNDYSPALTIDITNTGSQLASNYSGNQPPVANAGGSYAAQTGQAVQLNGAASFDPDGTIVNYTWNFGDGTTGTGAVANHQYGASGVYPVSLTVSDNNGSTNSAQGFVTVDSVALPVKITFDELTNNTVVADQYLNQYGVRFSSANFFFPVHTKQDCGLTCSAVSFPNFISTKPDDTGQLIVTFQQPVSNLVFYAVGVDTLSGTFAFVDLYRNGSVTPSNTFAMNGNFTATVGFSSGTLNNIDKVVVRGVNDALGIGFDDFSFTVPADVKITSGRVNGYLNGTTQNALLGADVALNASPLPGAFGGETYNWSCVPSPCPILTTNNSSSVTLRTNELSSVVGNYTVTVNYNKSGVTTSGSFTINSILPTLTSFTATSQVAPSIWRPFSCVDQHPNADPHATSQWWFAKGCTAANSSVGINFHAKVDVDSFVSDPTKSGVKYVQAYSTYRKIMSRGIRCLTDRSTESDIASGYRADRGVDATKDIYDKNNYMDFSGLLTSIGIDENDSPGQALTRFDDWAFVDAVSIDDRAEMYLVYYSGSDPYNPPIQRPLGKYAWNWGGLVVFDWNGSDAVHIIRSLNPTYISPPSTFPQLLLPNKNEKQCPDGTPFTDNPIDSSREFVKYHYKDFLGRDPTGDKDANGNWIPGHEPDPRGWNFWTSNISQCVFDLNCVHARRISTGLAFFLSNEFMRSDPIMANGPGTPNFDREACNRQFVFYCYKLYLKTEPDLPGWNYWTDGLDHGVDQDNYGHIIDAFQLCADYRQRTFE